MSDDFLLLLQSALASLQRAGGEILLAALIFATIAVVAGGREAFTKARNARGEIITNLSLNVFDIIVMTPVFGILLALMGSAMQRAGLVLVRPDFWAHIPGPLVAFLAVFAGDFIGYWRHRLEHTPPLWPAHAIHHSDTRMTWTTLFRFHPINRLSTVLIDTAFLALLGFPPWALFINNMVRHYWGMFIHMDVPWTFGLLGRVFVSPVMHRWHHVRDGEGVGSNFATAFSVFDQAFGTYFVPRVCDVPLGVQENVGRNALEQLIYPLKVAVRVATRPFARRIVREPA
jgi:sterol desaturase/sphingolipid hydroxylase (fatty acid hydroxylase superfamily)